MSNAITFRMSAGIPGDVTRPQTATIEAQVLDGTNYPTVYGVPVAIASSSKGMRSIGAGDTASLVYGLYVRPYPTSGNGTDGLGTSTPPTSGIVSVLKRGYMNVKVNVGTAAKGGTVYVRIAANGVNTIIGGIEATADSTYTITLANAYFTGAADSNGMCEIAYNL